MTLKSNVLLKFLVPLVVMVVLLVMLRACGGGGEPDTAEQREDPTLRLSDDEMDALGIEGDTPRDTVATLVGQVQSMRDELDRSQAETEALREQNEQLVLRNQNIDKRIDEALNEERERLQADRRQQSQQEEGLLGSLQQQLNQLQNRIDSSDGTEADEEMPIGMGLEDGGAPSSMSWVEPMDSQEGLASGRNDEEVNFPSSFGEAASSASDAARRSAEAVESRVTGEPPESTVKPVYTVPENSTLMGSLAMTALIGRVPVDGTVTDPFPFKIIVGQDNLTANGVEVPEVQAAIMSGTATGDWTLSCVRGDVHSVTFVFQDGTVRTLPSPEDLDSGDSGSRTKIGWISDEMGIPCVSGERNSNAKQYLGTQSLLTAAGAGVASMLSDDGDIATTINPDGSVTQAMTGSQATQQIMASGVNDMSRWVNRLYGEAFAAVFVPPGRDVAVHIDRELQIDYETEGRRVHYDRDLSLRNDIP
ncbi:TIGR03752 family integrating conjugative element protein [Billgrantia montanilacus]|uniref:TIGR03752 family integrating conjugative element protein n=1 Tax=Billgrantia montanilacus TaxID=2282305 RepID=A0A368TUU5_9GAMM|nr:TIGR03752 family integrating conjugative element protein [Halomonas montanilacus]RCV86913.1 TIGR03752 family integrating conjugative element protein [Halomonas montanilacus]